MVRLSALVCVRNQGDLLADCLRGLSFCDEVVVVADRCTDRSQEIARRCGATLVDGIFPLESQRKAAGVEACSGDWILEIDPEERVDAHLAWEIRAMLILRSDVDWYELPIDNYVGLDRVRRGWDGQLGVAVARRLYKRGLKAWPPSRFPADGVLAGRSGGRLKGALRRSVGAHTGALVVKLDRLAALRAEDLADRGVAPRFVVGLAAGARACLASYLARGGWREGRLGVLVALLSGLLPIMATLRAGELLAARHPARETARPDDREVLGLAR